MKLVATLGAAGPGRGVDRGISTKTKARLHQHEEQDPEDDDRRAHLIEDALNQHPAHEDHGAEDGDERGRRSMAKDVAHQRAETEPGIFRGGAGSAAAAVPRQLSWPGSAGLGRRQLVPEGVEVKGRPLGGESSATTIALEGIVAASRAGGGESTGVES